MDERSGGRPIDLGRRPRMHLGTAILPEATLGDLWLGDGPAPAEVVRVEANRSLSDPELRQAWQQRLGRRATVLWLFGPVADGLGICGPDEPPAVTHLPTSSASAVLRQVLQLPSSEAVRGYLALLGRSQGSAGVPGLRNRHLLSTHYLTEVLPMRQREHWQAWSERSLGLGRLFGRRLLEGLGFTLTGDVANEPVLNVDDRGVAVAHIYPAHVNLDRMRRGTGSDGAGVQPAALALEAARKLGLPYAMLAAGSVLRLHRTVPSGEFEETAASGAYVEIDLSLLPDAQSALCWAVFSAEALAPGGVLEQAVGEAERYAVGLRDRFRERVYAEVVPAFVRGLWQASRQSGSAVLEPDVLYRATLVLLFRTLFVLYAEDRNLLPVRHPGYWQRSLTRRVQAILNTQKRGPEAFDPRQYDIWDDLRHIFAAVRDGHREWGVPPYDGGLFEDGRSPEAELLARVRLSNRVVGPALHQLAVDRQGEEEGKVDFADLGVRHLGSLYEGLLSFRAVIAETNLTVSRREKAQTYRPAAAGEAIAVPAGEPYLASPEGGRKNTGSYYTPAFAVNRLVEGALAPVLAAHRERLDALEDPAAAAAALFDVKVCDPAMGSGHFLTRALDLIAEWAASYLAGRPLPAVADELDRARQRITAVGREYGAPDLGEGASDFDLLRRVALKRCIYGVDLNPLAVELARLSLWLRAFVPGLPLGYLGHTLVWGNSLVGVAGPELAASFATEYPLFGQRMASQLAATLDQAEELGTVDDLELQEVERSEALQERIREHAAPVREVYDAYTGRGFRADLDWAEFVVTAAGKGGARLPVHWAEAATEARERWQALHWPLAFPEVFLRERPGFDAVLGNPPWEEVTVEELGFFTRYIPGLKSEKSPDAQRKRIAGYRREHRRVAAEYERQVAETAALRAYLKTGYELTRSGDPDLYRAFCERFLHVLRQGGSLGVVLPRTAFSGDGTAPFRARLFSAGSRVQLDFLYNTNGWVFPDVHSQNPRIALTVCTGAPDDATVVTCGGPAESPEQFALLDAERIEWTVDELRKASDGLEVPLIPGRASALLFRRLVAAHPRFDSAEGGFRAVPWTELHATKDRKSGLLRESGPGWPVYTGESFDLWNPDHTPPVQVVPPDVGLAELQRKRQRSSVWRKHFHPRVLADPGTLPQRRARILFRDITNCTNSRTVIACLVPPRVFAVNKAPSLLFPLGDWFDRVYVLGLMCSVPFDWLARRRVETNLNFFILDALPLPRMPKDSALRQRIVAVAGRLACTDERFAEVAEAIGVPSASLDPEEKAALIAELDALGAHAYGLSEDELRLMFADFPETEAGISSARRQAVLRHFGRLAGVRS